MTDEERDKYLEVMRRLGTPDQVAEKFDTLTAHHNERMRLQEMQASRRLRWATGAAGFAIMLALLSLAERTWKFLVWFKGG